MQFRRSHGGTGWVLRPWHPYLQCYHAKALCSSGHRPTTPGFSLRMELLSRSASTLWHIREKIKVHADVMSGGVLLSGRSRRSGSSSGIFINTMLKSTLTSWSSF